MCYSDHHKATHCTLSRKFCHSPCSNKIFPLFQSERKLQRLHLIDVVNCWPWSHTTWFGWWWPVVICSLIMIMAHHEPPSSEITGKSEVGVWVIHISSAGFVWPVSGWESGVCMLYLFVAFLCWPPPHFTFLSPAPSIWLLLASAQTSPAASASICYTRAKILLDTQQNL